MEAPRELRSVGISVFMSEYNFMLKNINSKLSIVEYLVDKNKSNEAGAVIRFSNVKAIFSNPKLHRQCLEYIAYGSKRMPKEIKEQAIGYLSNII